MDTKEDKKEKKKMLTNEDKEELKRTVKDATLTGAGEFLKSVGDGLRRLGGGDR